MITRSMVPATRIPAEPGLARAVLRDEMTLLAECQFFGVWFFIYLKANAVSFLSSLGYSSITKLDPLDIFASASIAVAA